MYKLTLKIVVFINFNGDIASFMGDRARQLFAIMAFTVTISLAQGVPESSKVVSADVIQAGIEMGRPADFDNYTITGELNLNQGVVHSEAHFNNSIFQGPAFFNSTSFKSPAYFRCSDFRNNADFSDADFDELTDFSGSTFDADADFSRSNFRRGSLFKNSIFNGSATFKKATFNDIADFSNDTFNSYSYFQKAVFNSYICLTGSNFLNCSYFNGARFCSSADFLNSYFNSSAAFSGADFNGYTRFDMSQFEGTANFYNSTFDKKVSFDGAEFNGITTFERAEFNDEAFFEGAAFRKLLSLTKSKYKLLYVNMNNIPQLEYEESAYQLLIENFKTLGYYDDADDGYYRFRTDRFFHRRPEIDPLMYVLDFGAWIFYGFGKKPLFALGWSLGTILLFGFFWSAVLIRKGESNPAKGQGLRSKARLLLDPFSFSATIFLSSTRLFIDPPEIPKSLRLSPSSAKGMFTLERILGAFFSILLFIAIGGTVVR